MDTQLPRATEVVVVTTAAAVARRLAYKTRQVRAETRVSINMALCLQIVILLLSMVASCWADGYGGDPHAGGTLHRYYYGNSVALGTVKGLLFTARRYA